MTDDEIMLKYSNMQDLKYEMTDITPYIFEALALIDEMNSSIDDCSFYIGNAKDGLITYNYHMKKFLLQVADLLLTGGSFIELCIEKTKQEDEHIRSLFDNTQKLMVETCGVNNNENILEHNIGT